MEPGLRSTSSGPLCSIVGKISMMAGCARAAHVDMDARPTTDGRDDAEGGVMSSASSLAAVGLNE